MNRSPLRRLYDRTPLRAKLIVSVLTLVIMALAAISICTVVVLRSYLTTQQDRPLKDAAATALPQWVSSVKNPAGTLYPLNSGIYIGVQLPGVPITNPGIAPNSGMPSPPAPSIPTSQTWAAANDGKLLTVPSTSGGGSWRVVVEPFTFTSVQGTTENATFIVAADLGDVNAVISRLVTIELIVGGAIMIVLASAGVLIIQANLRPLNDIEMTAGQIAKGHLDHRVPEGDPRTEIGSLGHSLNAMLSQIEQAFHAQQKSEQAAHESEERMRRFIADASHELRTPLTTIRGFAEYYRQRKGIISRTAYPDSPPASGTSAPVSGPMTGEELDRLMTRVESEASRMGLLVEDLLQLARLDQQRPLDLGPVDLLTLAADAVQDARIVAAGRPVDLVIDKGAAFIVNGDEPRLRQVLANLVNNALTHTPDGTAVRVRIGAGSLNDGSPAVRLDVEDDGPGMSAEQARRVFERFYRADAARNRASGGTGLGLAIVAGLVEAHGGTVSVRTAPGEGADFRVMLPLSPDALGALGGDEEADA